MQIDATKLAELRAMPAMSCVLTALNYADAWVRCSDLRDTDGRVVGNIPHTLVVPPQLQMAGATIVRGAFLSPEPAGLQMDNPLRGSTDLFWSPSLSDQPKRWYIVGDQGAVAMEAP